MLLSYFLNPSPGILSLLHPPRAGPQHSLAGLLKTHPRDPAGLTSPQFIVHSTVKAVSLEFKLGSERLPSVLQVKSASVARQAKPFRKRWPRRLLRLQLCTLPPITLTAWSALNEEILFLHPCACYSLHPEHPSNAYLPFKFQLTTNLVSPQEAFHDYSPHHHYPMLIPAAQQPIYT